MTYPAKGDEKSWVWKPAAGAGVGSGNENVGSAEGDVDDVGGWRIVVKRNVKSSPTSRRSWISVDILMRA